ncbi:SDR family oxidoreductase [Mycetocola tolaasinivorans]|uniref:SDR family oxidoreductase n=1 Tax=Mycetocola tolaasinivorans TaxID=76635 RepID=A0A3L7ACU2_9MICO|nr:SDR family oxidoreductase [Mycetocola tolaasinivorans]RLP77548.1 SDR family oxidoreductase [Mycetocola tolaasinivorans]
MSVSSSRLAVTGSSGALGGAVAAALAEAGYEQRLVVRSQGRAPRLPGTTVVTAAYGHTAQARDALRGTDVLFMVSAAESEDRVAEHVGFIDAAAEAGVSHIVYTSFLGAAEDATFTLARDHWATEQHLRASGVNYTILRDSFYLDALVGFADESGVIQGPAGSGRVSAVARADVARVATRILTDPGAHRGRTYDLTGPTALTLDDVAEAVTRHTGRPTRFEDQSIAEAEESRSHYGVPRWQLDAWVSTYTAIAAGEMATVSDAVLQITGEPATDIDSFLSAGA